MGSFPIHHTIGILAKFIERVTRLINGIAMVILALMMFLTAADVILRYVFNCPIPGAFELQEFMMAIMIAAAVGYCAFIKGHINVDIIFILFPQRVQAILNVFHYLIGSCLFAMVCWRTLLEGQAIQARGLTSAVLLIPVFPFYFMVAFGAALLSLVWLYEAIESLFQVGGKWTQQP
ncbi:TRAP transporter small permease subunit [Thermodesulfobacteriota bacterium]